MNRTLRASVDATVLVLKRIAEKYGYKPVILILIAAVAVGLVVLIATHNTIGVSQVTLGGQTYHVDVADTPSERAQGLSGREALGPDNGMLFIFDEPAANCFWMKDMNFSIDILWFDKDGKLIHQARNATPESYPSNFCPDAPAKYVLEVPAGEAEQHGFNEGSKLDIKL